MGRRKRVTGWERSKSRGNLLSRKEGVKEELPSILVVCEGAKTEPLYFQNFRVPSLNLIIVPAASVHKSVVERAIEENDKDSDYDEVWCVFDRDKDPRNKKDKQLFNEALSLAESNQFEVAYSNDAFEVWYLLHFIYFDTQLTRDEYIKRLSKHIPGGYKKNDPDIYSKLEDKMDDAIQRAKTLLKNEHHDKKPIDADPSTTVFRLVEKLRHHTR